MTASTFKPIDIISEAIPPRAAAVQATCGCTDAAVVHGCPNVETKEVGRCLVDIRRHVSRMYIALDGMVKGELLENALDHSWREVEHHLFLAQSIDGISANSSYFEVQDPGPCSVWHALDGVMDGRTENYMTSSVRFGFIWTAFETFGKLSGASELPTSTKKESEASARKGNATAASKNLAAKLDLEFQVDDVLRNAIGIIRRSSSVIGDIRGDLERVIFNDAVTGLVENFEYLRKVVTGLRNHYVHGEETLEWPSGDELLPGRQDAKTNALVDRHQAMSRIILMMMQLTLTRLAVTAATMRVGTEIDENGDHDDTVVELELNHVLKHLHMAEYGASFRITVPEAPHVESLPEAFANERLRRRHARSTRAVAA